jgi:hypothetical protein
LPPDISEFAEIGDVYGVRSISTIADG